MSEKTVQSIMKQWLIDNGYDGLCCDECGCGVDDLMPCSGDYGSGIDQCVPGFKVPCDPETCEYGGECEYHISEVREVKNG